MALKLYYLTYIYGKVRNTVMLCKLCPLVENMEKVNNASSTH